VNVEKKELFGDQLWDIKYALSFIFLFFKNHSNMLIRWSRKTYNQCCKPLCCL